MVVWMIQRWLSRVEASSGELRRCRVTWHASNHTFIAGKEIAWTNNTGSLIPKAQMPACQKCTAISMDDSKVRFSVAGAWAIFNSIQRGRKFHVPCGEVQNWDVGHLQEDGWPGGVTLCPGDAAIMVLIVLYCVYTLITSICLEGPGWIIAKIELAHSALMREAKIKSNRTSPLWYPAFVTFAIEFMEGADKGITSKWCLEHKQLQACQQLFLTCLHSNYLFHSGKPPKNLACGNGTLADYSWSEILPNLKTSEGPANCAVVQLMKRLYMSKCCEVTTRSTKVGYLMYLGNSNGVILVLILSCCEDDSMLLA